MELVESIRQKGIIEPIIVRPTPSGKTQFQVVAGDRRLRAACLVSKNRNVQSKIPAIIRELTDEEAFDFMIIENLQREDLTPFEEAQSFKQYYKKKGKGAIPELAARIGKSASFIRRKIAVLSLPPYVLKSWEKEEISFSHLEQLRRLKSKEALKEAFEFATGERFGRGYTGDGASKRKLKEHIDNTAPPLEDALFNIEKEGCTTCGQNSDVQQKLWDIGGMEGIHCLDKKCFKQKQNNFLQANWKQSKYRKRYGTNGFRFHEDVTWSQFNSFEYGPKPIKKCKECDKFLTLINLDGSIETGQVCFGEEICFRAVRSVKAKEEQRKEIEEKKESGAPRVDWHGEHFREEFLSKTLPERYRLFGHADIKMARMALFAFVKLDRAILSFMAQEIKLKNSYHDKTLFERIAKMELDEIQELMQKCALEVIMRHWPVTCEGRLAAATHLGINLTKEFAVTKDYLEHKTIREMLEFGKKSNIFREVKVREYLIKTLKKKPGRFDSCKKTELIDVFLKSGVNLVGKVPDEISQVNKK
jgi:ParB/RepB/Spo0J family partition protein